MMTTKAPALVIWRGSYLASWFILTNFRVKFEGQGYRCSRL